ncbi:MAG: hypothetical protein JO317_01660, partial [Verrucomicrobiae bacterium]|nr:hypothetical protein [Verrucomicrobiae bacterium]
ALGVPFDPALGPLVPYLGPGGEIKKCPSFRPGLNAFEAGCGGYGYNEVYIGGRGDLYDYFSDPKSAQTSLSLDDGKALALSSLVMFADSGVAYPQGVAEYSFLEPPFWESPPGTVTAATPDPSVHFRHNGRANVIWADGHVSRESMSQTTPFSAFGGDNGALSLGWFGPRVNNADWKN